MSANGRNRLDTRGACGSRLAATLLAGLLCAGLALAAAAPAQAAEPLKIREAFPGSTALGTDAEFVELQMTADGQGAIEGQELRFFDAAGDPIPAATYVLTEGDAEGLVATTQRTVLLATAPASALGGGAAAPAVVPPPADNMSPAGGAVCFTAAAAAAPADCVAWGSFPIPGFGEESPIPDPQSANASPGGITDDFSLDRSIEPGCPTYLDGPDDNSGNSATDFAEATPSPRNNATPREELYCPPETFILGFPSNPTNSSSASFTYTGFSQEAGLEFECDIASAPSQFPPEEPPPGDWVDCTTQPQQYTDLDDGFYRFWVRAIGEEGGPDQTPASSAWRVDTTPPQTTILSTPPSPDSGASVTYTYASSEPSSSFRCQMDDGAIQVCSGAGRTYFNLIDGVHTFRVWATDNAGNQDPIPATHSFTVNTALADKTPPDTSILLAPPAVSPKDSAFFAYTSNESPASFECSLDGGPFAPCGELGIGYQRLANGPHVFAVRAIDRAGNVDSVPATHAWRVAAALPRARITRAPAGRVLLRAKLRRCDKRKATRAQRRCVRKALRRARARVVFRFASSKPGSTFRCRVGKRAFRPCRPPFRFKAPRGRHRFEVFAIDSLGNRQATPTRRIFRVVPPRRGGLFGR